MTRWEPIPLDDVAMRVFGERWDALTERITEGLKSGRYGLFPIMENGRLVMIGINAVPAEPKEPAHLPRRLIEERTAAALNALAPWDALDVDQHGRRRQPASLMRWYGDAEDLRIEVEKLHDNIRAWYCWAAWRRRADSQTYDRVWVDPIEYESLPDVRRSIAHWAEIARWPQ